MDNNLLQLMSSELPNITYQRKLLYRPTIKEVEKLYNILNKEIFDNQLSMPTIQLRSRCRKYWGYCIAQEFHPLEDKSLCLIKLSDKWCCKQWLIVILAHEMCHQYQYDIDGVTRIEEGKEPIISHGPSFFKFKSKLKEFNIPLNREAMSMKKWFKTQDLWKC